MPASLLFWILMLLWLLGGAIPYFKAGSRPAWNETAGSLVIYLLIGILGWHVFGGPIQ